jgi:hypothetical protein
VGSAQVQVEEDPSWFKTCCALSKAFTYFSGKSTDFPFLEQYQPDDEKGQALRAHVAATPRGVWRHLVMAINNVLMGKADPNNAKDLTLDDKNKASFPSLQYFDKVSGSIAAASVVVFQLYRMMQEVFPMVDLKLAPNRSNLTDGFRNNRDIMLWVLKRDQFQKAVTKTMKSYPKPTVELELVKAKAFEDRGDIDVKGTETLFGQWFTQLKGHPADMFIVPFKSRAWEANYTGLRSIDAGGPYRDSIERLTRDIEGSCLNLFITSPNARLAIGDNRDTFVPNPAATNRHQLQMYTMIGRLLGLSLRSKHLLNLHLPSIVWKPLVNSVVTIEDVQAVDVLSFQILEQISQVSDSKQFDQQMAAAEVTFLVTGSDGLPKELKHDGANIPLTWENRKEYIYLLTRFRCDEFALQTAALKRGLAEVVPMDALTLFTWKELETQVCGRGMSVKDVDLLQEMTKYNGYSATDSQVRWLFAILREDFTEQQRGDFLTFVWGRSRLPLTKVGFETKFGINVKDCSDPDSAWPLAHTCFFSIDLPKYTSRALLASRISSAIAMAGAIDAD